MAQNIACYDRLDDLPKPARQLLAEEGQRRFFNGHSWYDVFCRTCLDDGQKPAFHHLTSAEGQLILPLITPLGRMGCKLSHRPLGANTCMSMTNYQTAYYGPITDLSGEVLSDALKTLASELREQRCAVIDFNHLDTGIPTNAWLRPAFQQAGFKTVDCIDEPITFENVEGQSYQDYMAARSANLRKNIKRRRNKLEKLGDVHFALMRDPVGIEKAIADYQHVQASSWKSAEVYDDHVPELIKTAAENGNLCLGVLYVDARPVATDLTILSDGNATSKKAHYDQTMREHHVGDVLTSYMFEYLMDVENIKSIDLGKTAVSYKLKWVKDQRPMYGFAAFNLQTTKGQSSWVNFKSKILCQSILSKIKSKVIS